MTKKKKDEPGAVALRGGDTFARLAKSAEKPPRVATRELREAGATRRTQKFADKKDAAPACLPGVSPGALRTEPRSHLRTASRVTLPTVPPPSLPIASAGVHTDSPAAAAIPGRPVKRVRLAEALRSSGLDELTVAQNYVVVEKLRDGSGGTDGTQKMLVDVLKECSRILEPPKSVGGASEAPAVVNLYHNVPRPVRDLQRDATQPVEQSE